MLHLRLETNTRDSGDGFGEYVATEPGSPDGSCSDVYPKQRPSAPRAAFSLLLVSPPKDTFLLPAHSNTLLSPNKSSVFAQLSGAISHTGIPSLVILKITPSWTSPPGSHFCSCPPYVSQALIAQRSDPLSQVWMSSVKLHAIRNYLAVNLETNEIVTFLKLKFMML